MTDDRRYVLRLRGPNGDEYVGIDDFSLLEYRCGLVAGDWVRLIKDIADDDDPTRVSHRRGEIWEVLSGSPQDPEALWLRTTDGELYGWDDDDSVWEQFERVEKS